MSDPDDGTVPPAPRKPREREAKPAREEQEDPLFGDLEERTGPAPRAPRAGSAGKALLFEMRVEIATMFGFGHIPFASGTIASAVTLPLAALLTPLGPTFYLAATAASIPLAIWAAQAAEKHFGTKDPHPVVIDELAGQLVALALVPFSLVNYAAGFVAFRFFDVVKPFPAARFEKIPGGAGIVLDDLVAGLYANLVVHAGLRVAAWMSGS